MDRLFSRYGSQAEVEAVLYEPRRRDPKTDPRPWDGMRRISVVGESNYQDALRRVSGAPVTGDWKFECEASLVPEPTNPHDPKAVMVQINGECVGYLSRRNASVFGPRVRAIFEAEGEAVCGAFVGRKGDSENPNLGVRLRAPEGSPLFKRFPSA
jgi:HIRAN domain